MNDIKTISFRLLRKCILLGPKKVFEDVYWLDKVDETNSFNLLQYSLFVERIYSISIREFINFYEKHSNNSECYEFLEIFSKEIKEINTCNEHCTDAIDTITKSVINDESTIYSDEYFNELIENIHILLSIEDYMMKIINYVDEHPNHNTHYFIDCIKMHNEYHRVINKLMEVTFNKKENEK